MKYNRNISIDGEYNNLKFIFSVVYNVDGKNKVKEARESIIKSIQSICIDLIGIWEPMQELITINEHTVKLITNWNCINLRRLSIIFLPYLIAVTIDEKLLFIKKNLVEEDIH